MVAPLPPSWGVLASLLPALLPPSTESQLVLHRDVNGWCLDSAAMWLALELKGLTFETSMDDSPL